MSSVGLSTHVMAEQRQEKDEQLWRIIEVMSSIDALIPVSVSLDEELSYRIQSLSGGVMLDMSLEGNLNVVTARRLCGNESQRVNSLTCCSECTNPDLFAVESQSEGEQQIRDQQCRKIPSQQVFDRPQWLPRL